MLACRHGNEGKRPPGRARGAPLRRQATLSPDRRAAAATAALGLLLVGPLVWLDALWTGPALIAAGLGHEGVWVTVGILFLVGTALPPGLLLAARGVDRGRARARVAALALALLSLGLALTPLHRVSALSWLPGGRWILALLALATLGLVALAARGRGDAPAGPPASLGHRRAAAALALAAGAVALGGAVAGIGGSGIPSSPSGLLLAGFEGSGRLTGEPLAAPRPAAFGGLQRGQGSNIHNDPGMSDAYFERHVTDPKAGAVRSYRAYGDCASLLFDRSGNLIAVCVGATRTSAHLLDPSTLEPRASREVSSRPLRADLLTNFSGGGYAVLDRRGRLVIPSPGGRIDLFRVEPAPGREAIRPIGSIDAAAGLLPGEEITSVLPESGRLWWFVGSEGTIGTVDPTTARVRARHARGRDIENSFALAPGGGAFVVDSGELMRLEAGPGGVPEVVWAEPYDAGERLKPGQTSRASGTTPTVMAGGRLVAIADNADPRLRVLVFRAGRRARGPRLLCSVPVFGERAGATENSLIAAGDALFVENNYGYRLLDVIGGHSSEPGAARIDVDRRAGECRPAWETEAARMPSVVSKVSAADGLMLTYAKPALPTGIDAWYFTAIDAATGEVLWRRLAGTGPMANNHYAALYLGPTGNLYVGTLGGVIGLTPDG